MLSAGSLCWSGGAGQVMVTPGITDALTVPLPCYSRWSQMLPIKRTLQPETCYRLKASVLPNLEWLIAGTAWIWTFCPLLCWIVFLLITGLLHSLDSCSLSDIWFINIFFHFDSFKVYNSIMFGIWMSFHFLDSPLWCSTVFQFEVLTIWFSFVVCAFGLISENPLTDPRSWRLILMLASKNFKFNSCF